MKTFTVDDIKLQHFNDRDVEVPALCRVVNEALPQIETLLDVGADYSWYTYAGGLRNLLDGRTYHACDIVYDVNTSMLVDKFITGNICDLDLEPYDMVTCISAIEHAGMTTYKVDDWHCERVMMMDKLVRLARNRLFMTFPFGEYGVHENQYANMTENDLAYLTHVAEHSGLAGESRFFYTEFAQGREPWKEISLSDAAKIPMDKSKGTQCLCLFDAERKEL